MKMTLKLLAALGIFVSAACATTKSTGAHADPETVAKIERVLAESHRTDEERARDMYRHPAQTLAFFGLHDNMTVVELFPGRGWFTAVLAPVLADKGRLVLPIADPNGPEDGEGVKYAKALTARMAAAPDKFSKAQTRIQPMDAWDLGPAGSADMVVTFRSLHNLKPAELEHLLEAVHTVLKPGGVLGVEDHRANPGADPAKGGDTGYVPEEWVIKTIEAKGFTLDAKSEINANPKDTKDYPEGVWTLPPTLALKEQDRDKYVAIGESDRMTLRFVRK
ncbi:MAG: class I SAM-dependent methyltransferase [Myxococcota bacterium]